MEIWLWLIILAAGRLIQALAREYLIQVFFLTAFIKAVCIDISHQQYWVINSCFLSSLADKMSNANSKLLQGSL